MTAEVVAMSVLIRLTDQSRNIMQMFRFEPPKRNRADMGRIAQEDQAMMEDREIGSIARRERGHGGEILLQICEDGSRASHPDEIVIPSLHPR